MTSLTIPPQVLDHPQAGLSVCHGCIEVVLLAMLIHREAFEVDVPPRSELRLDRSRDVDGALHVELLDATLHHRELDGDHTRHLNGATERDLTVTWAVS